MNRTFINDDKSGALAARLSRIFVLIGEVISIEDVKWALEIDDEQIATHAL